MNTNDRLTNLEYQIKYSNLYKKLYEEQILLGEADSEYEFSNQYAHILISGQSNNPQLVQDMLITEIEKLKNKNDDISVKVQMPEDTVSTPVVKPRKNKLVKPYFFKFFIKISKCFYIITFYR